VRRDIEYLRYQLKAPIEFDSRRNGYYYTEKTYRLPLLQFTEGELVSLFLGEQLLRQYRGTPYALDIERAFAKIITALDQQITVDVQRLSEAISFRTSAPAIFDVEILRTLIGAIIQRRRVVIDYWTGLTIGPPRATRRTVARSTHTISRRATASTISLPIATCGNASASSCPAASVRSS
jgi:predicted DNA-binding transcriptional regulator YafY